MPTVNIYYKDEKNHSALKSVVNKLKIYLAEKLTCDDIKLTPEEISIRLVAVDGDSMMGDVELEITAHEFPARVEKQDEICHDTAIYIQKEVHSVGDVKVWLKLCQLGHSVIIK